MNIENAAKRFLIKLGETVGNTRYDDDVILVYLNNGRRKVAFDTRFHNVVESLTVANDGEREFPLKSSFIDLWDAAESVSLNTYPLVRKTLSDKQSIEMLDLQIFPQYIFNSAEGNGYYFKIGQVIYVHPPTKAGDELVVRGYAYPPELTVLTGIDNDFYGEFENLAILAAVIEAKSDTGKDYSLDLSDYRDRAMKLKRTRDNDGPRYESISIR